MDGPVWPLVTYRQGGPLLQGTRLVLSVPHLHSRSVSVPDLSLARVLLVPRPVRSRLFRHRTC